MTPKHTFEAKLLTLDKTIIDLHPNNHKRREYIRSFITDDLLKHLYFIEGMSANNICSYFANNGIPNGGAGVIIDRLKSLGLSTRSIKETCYLDKVQSQKINTLKAKYGVSNISQIQEVKEKKVQQCLKRYGVTNNFKSEEIKRKIKEFWQTNYGADHPSEIRNYSGKVFNLSKPHRAVLSILDVLNVVYEYEENRYFKAYNPILEKRYCPRVDIFIPSKNLVIEVFGTYWHADPRNYKSTDLFHTVYGHLTAEQIWCRDKIKIDHISALGYNIEVVWESDISKENIEQIILKYEDTKN
jgi:hypothetical protein